MFTNQRVFILLPFLIITLLIMHLKPYDRFIYDSDMVEAMWADSFFTTDDSYRDSDTEQIDLLNQDIKYNQREKYANYNFLKNAGVSEVRIEAYPCNGNWPRDIQTQIIKVTNPATGQTWMDRNLGASRAATYPTDPQAFGDLYQWGRAADGHQKRNSDIVTTLSKADQPDHGSFIIPHESDYPPNWRNPRNSFLWGWQGEVDTINTPCPCGYRLPTHKEWDAERKSWSSNNASGAFNSPLKLPVAGGRLYNDGSMMNVNSNGYYWTGINARGRALYMSFNRSTAYVSARVVAHGFSVRCIKN